MYRHIRLPYGAAPADNMFLMKIDKLLSGMPNVFSITYDILITGFHQQDKNHDKTSEKVFWTCRQANLKLNQDNCLFGVLAFPPLAR